MLIVVPDMSSYAVKILNINVVHGMGSNTAYIILLY